MGSGQVSVRYSCVDNVRYLVLLRSLEATCNERHSNPCVSCATFLLVYSRSDLLLLIKVRDPRREIWAVRPPTQLFDGVSVGPKERQFTGSRLSGARMPNLMSLALPAKLNPGS